MSRWSKTFDQWCNCLLHATGFVDLNDVALRCCDGTNVWLDLFCHCLIIASTLGLYNHKDV